MIVRNPNKINSQADIRLQPLNTGIDAMSPTARGELRQRLARFLDDDDPIIRRAAGELVAQVDALQAVTR